LEMSEERARRWLADEMGAVHEGDDAAVVARTVALAFHHDHDPGLPPPYSPGDWTELRVRASKWLADEGATVSGIDQLLLNSRDRLSIMVADLLTSAPLAPPVQLSHSVIQEIPDRAVVFSAWPHAKHELWPVMVDALMYGGAVAVHDTWLDHSGRALRVITYEPSLNRLVESDLAVPIHLKRVLLLLGREDGETAWHKSMADILVSAGATLLNPAPTASMVDDKWAAYECWRDAGVPTPETVLITAKGLDTWRTALNRRNMLGGAVVVKPRHGTGARNVHIVDDPEEVAHAVERVLATGGDVIVQPYYGTMRVRSDRGKMCAAVLRLNVAMDREGMCRTESGYVHVARDPASKLASLAQGGRSVPVVRDILALDDALLGDALLGVNDVQHIVAVAESAARVVMAGTGARILGIDLVAQHGASGELQAYVIEANSRPAGLAHSRMLMRDWESSGEPGVSTYMWE
jgi:D-alanine-D-alanine ligase-like ATP-grasp enzyme